MNDAKLDGWMNCTQIPGKYLGLCLWYSLTAKRSPEALGKSVLVVGKYAKSLD